MPSQRRPSVAFSQNFIKDPALVRCLIQAMCLSRGDLVYEIGPGRGILTRELARHGCRVVAVERDARLARRLALELSGHPNVAVHVADFLTFPLPLWPYKVVANPPFNISSALVSRLFTESDGPDEAHLAIQRELADRVLGSTLYGLSIQPWFAIEVTYRFRRADFTPQPGVDVVMLRLRKRGPPLVPPEHARLYRDFLAYTFTHAHPTVGSALRAVVPELPRALAGRTCRQLALNDWLALLERLAKLPPERITPLAGAGARLRRQQASLEKRHRTVAAKWT